MEGYLSKRSDHIKRWNKRYFRLEGAKLSYHEDGSSTKARGTWVLDSKCNISKFPGYPNAFMLTIRSTPVMLAADDASAMDKWWNALSGPMGKAVKSTVATNSTGASASGVASVKSSYSSKKKSKGGPSYLFGNQQKYDNTGEHLRDAIKHRDFNACRKILQAKQTLSTFVDNSDNSVLHLAVLFNDKKIAQLLVECGADINLRNKRKETPISLAKPVMRKCLKQWGTVNES